MKRKTKNLKTGEAISFESERFEIYYSIFLRPQSVDTSKDDAVDDVKPKKKEVDEKPPPETESDKRNGTSEGDSKGQCDKSDATAIEVLSANAVTQEQQQNNKNGKNNNNNNINKKNKKNAREKLDSQACDEVGDVEA